MKIASLTALVLRLININIITNNKKIAVGQILYGECLSCYQHLIKKIFQVVAVDGYVNIS